MPLQPRRGVAWFRWNPSAATTSVITPLCRCA